MAAVVSGLERARQQVAWEGVAERLTKCLPEKYRIYDTDKGYAPEARMGIAIITGIAKVPLFPIACAIGVLRGPVEGCYEGSKTRQCHTTDHGNMGAVYCFLGLAGSIAFLGAAAYGGLTLNQAMGIFIGALAVSIIGNVYYAAKPHALSEKI